ncbi:unnamed protein product [Lactuca virosa]|uniref:RING-type E3 ubiquitin transferase n=1 Tax=Lactuca virosa TaxID=75947 RepID=A0AAU9MJM0_9ASTR|nr:unnamed protein product [Lactuca virosa]
MGQRNMVYTGPILETEHGHLHPEAYGGIPSFNPQRLPENHTILPPLPGNRTSFNPQHLPENHAPLPHTMTQYDHHPHNVYMTPPGARIFPVAINHGIPDQIPFSIRGRNDGQFMDGIGINGAFKRKNAEGFPGNIHYFYPAAAAGPSSSVAIPMNTEGGMMDGGSGSGSFGIPEFRGGNRGGSGGIGVDPVLAHSSGHLIPGNYGVPAPWLDQQFCGNGGDSISGAFSWNHAPGLPYLQGHMNEAANIGLHGYGNRNSGAFVHGPHNLHHPPPPPMPPMQGHNMNMEFHSQLASTSLRLPANTATINPFQNGMEPPGPGPRFVGPTPTPPTGLRVYRPHRRELMLEATARHRGFPHLRVLPEDGVAILDISGYHEVGHSVDHHRDMRLDIDHMSYEELLALGEQIGSVGSRLSDDFVVEHLKTRVFTSSKSSNDQELNSCVICQTNYDDGEEIGVVDCGHEYHVECVKKWLVVKNTCPVCKSTALAGQPKESVS